MEPMGINRPKNPLFEGWGHEVPCSSFPPISRSRASAAGLPEYTKQLL